MFYNVVSFLVKREKEKMDQQKRGFSEFDQLLKDLALLETDDLIELIDLLGVEYKDLTDDQMRSKIAKSFYNLDERLPPFYEVNYLAKKPKKSRSDQSQDDVIDPNEQLSVYSNFRVGQLKDIRSMSDLLKLISQLKEKGEKKELIDKLVLQVLPSKSYRRRLGMTNADETKFINFDDLKKIYVPGAREEWTAFFRSTHPFVKEQLKNIDYLVAQNRLDELRPLLFQLKNVMLPNDVLQRILYEYDRSVLVQGIKNFVFPPQWLPAVLSVYTKKGPFTLENIARRPENMEYFNAMLDYLGKQDDKEIQKALSAKYMEPFWNQKKLVSLEDFYSFLKNRQAENEQRKAEKRRLLLETKNEEINPDF